MSSTNVPAVVNGPSMRPPNQVISPSLVTAAAVASRLPLSENTPLGKSTTTGPDVAKSPVHCTVPSPVAENDPVMSATSVLSPSHCSCPPPASTNTVPSDDTTSSTSRIPDSTSNVPVLATSTLAPMSLVEVPPDLRTVPLLTNDGSTPVPSLTTSSKSLVNSHNPSLTTDVATAESNRTSPSTCDTVPDTAFVNDPARYLKLPSSVTSPTFVKVPDQSPPAQVNTPGAKSSVTPVPRKSPVHSTVPSPVAENVPVMSATSVVSPFHRSSAPLASTTVVPLDDTTSLTPITPVSTSNTPVLSTSTLRLEDAIPPDLRTMPLLTNDGSAPVPAPPTPRSSVNSHSPLLVAVVAADLSSPIAAPVVWRTVPVAVLSSSPAIVLELVDSRTSSPPLVNDPSNSPLRQVTSPSLVQVPLQSPLAQVNTPGAKSSVAVPRKSPVHCTVPSPVDENTPVMSATSVVSPFHCSSAPLASTNVVPLDDTTSSTSSVPDSTSKVPVLATSMLVPIRLSDVPADLRTVPEFTNDGSAPVPVPATVASAAKSHSPSLVIVVATDLSSRSEPSAYTTVVPTAFVQVPASVLVLPVSSVIVSVVVIVPLI